MYAGMGRLVFSKLAMVEVTSKVKLLLELVIRLDFDHATWNYFVDVAHFPVQIERLFFHCVS